MNFQSLAGDPVFILLMTMIGFAVMVMGRHIFWVFIAGLGFVLGLYLSSNYYNAQFEWQVFLISSLVAVVGALLANTLQRLAGGVAGLATGWYLANLLMGYIHLNLGQLETLIPYIVGIISGALILIFFDWGVIIGSSLAGAAIVISGISFNQNVELILLIMFSLLGIAIQTIWFMQDR